MDKFSDDHEFKKGDIVRIVDMNDMAGIYTGLWRVEGNFNPDPDPDIGEPRMVCCKVDEFRRRVGVLYAIPTRCLVLVEEGGP
jgi:hypothetical protein